MRVWCLASWISLTTALFGAPDFDETKPYGRCNVTVIDGVAKTEEPLAEKSKPGPQRFVTVHLDANAECEVLVAAFDVGDGKFAYEWRPAILGLREWSEKTIGNQTWAWGTPGKPFEVVVLFFAPGSADAAQMKKLVAAVDPKADARLLGLQANKLHELIGQAIADKDLSKYRAKAQTAEIAGVMRGDSFAWRETARRANFTPAQPGS